MGKWVGLEVSRGMRCGRRLFGPSGETQALASLPQDIKSGRSPLIHAVESNSLSMVQLLLQVGPAPAPRLSPTLAPGTNQLPPAGPGSDAAFQLSPLFQL